MSTVSIRYMIDDVPAAIEFYTTYLGFTLQLDASPAFASVTRDGVRLLLSGNTSSCRRPMPDGREPVPGGWNRIHTQLDDLEAEVNRLREAGLTFRNDIITGPGGSQILLDDPSGNPSNYFSPNDKGLCRSAATGVSGVTADVALLSVIANAQGRARYSRPAGRIQQWHFANAQRRTTGSLKTQA